MNKRIIVDVITAILLTVATAVVVIAVVSRLLPRFGTHRIIIAAGSADGETLPLMKAVKAVAERYDPRLEISFLDTNGTVDSLNRLERSEAQMVTTEADIIAGPSARSVAILFPDTVQVLVRNDSGIKQFTDLRGKRIALVRSQGPFRTFLLLAQHFGMREADFNFIGADDPGAERAFTRGEADVYFAVRPLHSGALTRLVAAGGVSFMPIEDALALHLEVPAFERATIPKDTYTGTPMVPAADVPTVSLDRLLLARSDVPDIVTYEIAQVLMERRQEIVSAIPDTESAVRPLPANIRPPDGRNSLAAGLHPGAATYYNHGEISFSEDDKFGASAAIAVLTILWVWALRTALRRRQKRYSDTFNRRVVELMRESQTVRDEPRFLAIRHELLQMMMKAVIDLDRDHVSEQSFQISRVVWQIAFDLIRERIAAIGIVDPAIATEQALQAESLKNRPWSMLKEFIQKNLQNA
jgi:TRAP transporter TAXI family solute receptor